MMLVAALVLVLLAAVVIGAYSMGARRAVKSFGEPTPETAKIETDSAAAHQAIVNEGEEHKREVSSADRDHLLDELRDSVRPKH